MSYKTDLRRVQGLGSAKYGTEHFWLQRMTAIALAGLTPFFVWTFAGCLGEPFEEVRVVYENPFNAMIAAMFVITASYHMALGIRVVIEDYVHNAGWRLGLLIANAMTGILLSVVGVFSIAKIAFSV